MAGVAAVQVDSIRRFNRFYTRRIGVLGGRLLDSPFSLAEARILYELAHRDGPAAAELAADLRLDPGYLSRLLAGLARRGLVARTRSASDARRVHLALSARGRRTFAALDARSREEVEALLAALPSAARAQLVDALATVERLLEGAPRSAAPYLLRTHRPGDLGWIVERHAALYASEYGWDGTFEGYVAAIAARFVERFDPRCERCFIAERDGANAGGVVLVRKAATVAQLRLLIVDPAARGLGIGKRLVAECERFARGAGYRKIVLWTNSILHAARHIYEEAGYRLVAEARHRSFGNDLVGQTWELRL